MTADGSIYIYTHSLPCDGDMFGSALASYAESVGADISRAFVEREEGGKPYLAGCEGIYFSITHTKSLWMCAFGNAPLGIDAENRERRVKEGIAKRFFHPDEALAVEHGTDFLDIWTAKESYVKYTGEGIRDNFQKFSVVKDGKLAENVMDARHVRLEYRGHIVSVCSAEIGEIFFSEVPLFEYDK